MKKWILVSLALLTPAVALAGTTASRLGVYTTDNVPGLTFGYTDQFGNFTAPVNSFKGGTSGTINQQPEAVASGTQFVANPALTSSAASLSLTSTVTPLPIPGFSYTLSPSATYVFHNHTHGSNASAGGIKLTTTGTAVPATYNVTTQLWYGGNIGALQTTTTVGTAQLASTTTYTDTYSDGTVTTGASGGGTFIIQAGQNVSDSTALAVSSTGSQMQIWRVQ